MTAAADDEHAHPRPWLLPALLLAGAVLGGVVGSVLGPRWKEPSLEPVVLTLRLCGTVFLSLLKSLVVPLVATSITVAVARMGDLRKMGRLALWTGAFFVGTTLLAVLTGLVLVDVIHPGERGLELETAAVASQHAAQAARTPAQAIYEVIAGMFPPNLASAAVEGNILGLIVFSMLFGAALTVQGERGRTLVEVLDVANEVLLRLVRWVVWLAPAGILGLVADRLGKAGGGAAVWHELTRLAWYAATVLFGLVLHGVVTLPILLKLFARRGPLRFAQGMLDSLITAFGTASSAATMAVTMRCAIRDNGVSRRAADFVIPLGTTVNMNGTALYEAVAAIFIAQSLGVDLSIGQQIIVLFTATLAAIGAAAIPEAGLVTLILVMTAVGLPPEGVGMILSIDWILDRFRTTVNVWGDAVGAAVIDRRLAAEAEVS